MKLTNKKESMGTILKSVDAMVVFHDIMLDFNDNELPKDVDLYNASTITVINDADFVASYVRMVGCRCSIG